jgi:hypothetical protein
MKYVEMKTAIAAAERKHGVHSLDLVSREILQTIASANLSNTKIRVTDIKNMDVFGTLPTILTRLKTLIEGGWIMRKEDPDDARIVLLEITPKARAVFNKISKALEKV